MPLPESTVQVDPRFPLGRREERPVFFACQDRHAVLHVPGVARAPSGVRCSWDAAWAVATLLHAPLPRAPVRGLFPLPGLDTYRALKLHERLRDYQKEAAIFLARRAYAWLADPLRSGKTAVALAAGVLVGAKKVLVICTALGRLVWADEIRKWLGVEALIVAGRGADEARQYCSTCLGSGTPQKGGACADCRAANGQSLGYRIYRQEIAPRAAAKRDLAAALTGAKYVIVNYDLLIPQRATDLLGRDYTREDLPGWTRALIQHDFDVALVDECFVGSTPVGARQIADLHVGDWVPSFNGTTRRLVAARVAHVFKQPVKQLVAVYMRNRRLICTPNHPIATTRGWVSAGDLTANHEVYVDAAQTGLSRDLHVVPNAVRGHSQEGVGPLVLRAGSRIQAGGPSIARVDRVEVLEPGGDGTFGGLCPDGQVYNLEVEGTNTYLAGGVVVHNCHRLRGRNTNQRRKGLSRGEQVEQTLARIDRVWFISGTPVYGFVRDLERPLKYLTKGLFGGPLWWDFDRRYAEGHRNAWGWEANGKSFEVELRNRLSLLMIKRPRSRILKSMPPKQRSIVHVDVTEQERRGRSKKGATLEQALERTPGSDPATSRVLNNKRNIAHALRETARLKAPFVVEAVLAELAERRKVVVFTYMRQAAERLAQMIAADCLKNTNRARMREVNTRVFCVHGAMDPDGRVRQAKTYREWQGASAFVATIDSVNEAISLGGTHTEIFADLHWDPTPLLQAEDRGYEVGTLGLNVVYFIARGTIDEHVQTLVLPKLWTVETVAEEREAGHIASAFVGEEETVEEIMQRHTAHLRSASGASP